MPKQVLSFSRGSGFFVMKDVLNLPPHRQREEDTEVDDEDGPVHGDVKRLRERAE